MPGQKPGGGGPKDQFQELVQLVIAYAKQETLDPIVRQAKALGKGLAGALLLAMGTILLSVGFLRALQAEFGSTGAAQLRTLAAPRGAFEPRAGRTYTYAYGTGAHLSGDLSWVPYMGGALFALFIAVVAVMLFLRGGRAR